MIARKWRILRTGGIVLAALACWCLFYAVAAHAARPALLDPSDVFITQNSVPLAAPSSPGVDPVSPRAETAAPLVLAVTPVSGTQVSNFTLTGSGFAAGQSVQLVLTRPDGVTVTYPVTANAQGGFQPSPLPGVGMPLGTYTLRAQVNQAEVAHAQFRIGPLPPFCRDLLANGGFELPPDFVDWDTSGAPLVSTSNAFSGQRLALLAGYNNANDRVAQTVVLPGNTQLARLSYWRARVPESSTPDTDRMSVALLRPDGLPAATVETVDSTTAANSWGRVLYTLPAGGQTLRLQYAAMTDARNRTAFGVDEVSLVACSQPPSDPGGQPPTTRVVTSKGVYAIAPGERTRVEVWLEDVADLYSADVTLSFDPNIVHAVANQADLGPFLYLPGQTALTHNTIDNTTGTARVVMSRLAPASPVSGSGVLFSFEVQGVALGGTLVSITQAIAAQVNGAAIETGTEDASLTVRTAPAAIIGRMTLQGRNSHGATSVHATGASDVTVLTNNLGDFRLDGLAPGQYTIRARHPGWLCGEKTVTVTAGQTLDLSTGQLVAGDVSISDVVDIFDLVRIAGAYDAPASTDPIADLNGSGRIDIGDLVLVGANHGLICPHWWQPPTEYAAKRDVEKRLPFAVRLVPQAPGPDGVSQVEVWADDLTDIGGIDLALHIDAKAATFIDASPFQLSDAMKDGFVVRNTRVDDGARLAFALPKGAHISGPLRLATVAVKGDAAGVTVAKLGWADNQGHVAGDSAQPPAQPAPSASGKRPAPSPETFGGRREAIDNWRRDAALPLR